MSNYRLKSNTGLRRRSRRCLLCSCTDFCACPEGCAWATAPGGPQVCTACMSTCPFCAQLPVLELLAPGSGMRAVACVDPNCPQRPRVAGRTWRSALRRWNSRAQRARGRARAPDAGEGARVSSTIEGLAKVVDQTVERKGHAVLCNAPEGEEPWPPFAYTVGLWRTHQHPELLVSALPTGVARLVLGRIAEAIERGQSFADGREVEGLIPSSRLTFAELPHTHRFPVVFINHYYRVRVPTLQVFYTDEDGRYPWQREASDPWRLANAYGDLAGSLRMH